MNVMLLLLICVTTFMQTVQGATTQKKTITYRNEDIEREQGLTLYSPVDASPEGIKSFLQNVYNRTEYLELLPTNLSHIIQLLQHGKKNNQSRAYAKSVLKLFSNKLKGIQYINGYAYSMMLAQLPDLIEYHFLLKRPSNLAHYKETVNSILYQTFLAKYDFFKKSPQEFFDVLSQEIIETLQHELPALSDDISAQELRHTTVRFLEIGLNKLVWHPEEYDKIWTNVKTISRQLEALMEHAIIDDANELDDLFWTLIHRFCYFLDLSHHALPVKFFEAIKNDIATDQLLLVELEEQEALITSKRDHLLHAVRTGLARKQGVAQGLILS